MNAIELLCQKHVELVGLLRDRGHDPGELDRALQAYLDLEQVHFFPLLELHARDEMIDGEGIEDLVDRTFLAHEELEDVHGEHAACAADDPELPAILDELLGALLQHFADQERELYPLLQAHVPLDVLDELGARMLARLERGLETVMSPRFQSPEA